MFRCDECGNVFETPEWEEWFEARPVGREPMAEGHCPDCGSVDYVETHIRRCWECPDYDDGMCHRFNQMREEDDECLEEEYA